MLMSNWGGGSILDAMVSPAVICCINVYGNKRHSWRERGEGGEGEAFCIFQKRAH